MEWGPDICLESFFGSLREEIGLGGRRSIRGVVDDLEILDKKTPSELRGKVCVLSLDGGGMPGIIPARLLAHLEELLQKKSGDPDARIADYFDVVTGEFLSPSRRIQCAGTPEFELIFLFLIRCRDIGGRFASHDAVHGRREQPALVPRRRGMAPHGRTRPRGFQESRKILHVVEAANGAVQQYQQPILREAS